MSSFLYEHSLLSFIALTLVIGGGMAMSTGGAVAQGWKSMQHLAFYTLLLTLADRFLHFALFEGSLLSAKHFLIDLIILLIFAGIGFMLRRRSQMKRQYGFRTRASGPIA